MYFFPFNLKGPSHHVEIKLQEKNLWIIRLYLYMQICLSVRGRIAVHNSLSHFLHLFSPYLPCRGLPEFARIFIMVPVTSAT